MSVALRVADQWDWPPQGETRKSGDNASGEDDARQLRRPPRVQAQRSIHRILTWASQCKRQRQHGVQERKFDAVRRRQQTFAPMHRKDGHKHHGDNRRGGDWHEQACRQEHPATTR